MIFALIKTYFEKKSSKPFANDCAASNGKDSEAIILSSTVLVINKTSAKADIYSSLPKTVKPRLKTPRFLR